MIAPREPEPLAGVIFYVAREGEQNKTFLALHSAARTKYDVTLQIVLTCYISCRKPPPSDSPSGQMEERMTYRTAHRPAAKQAWEIGQIVNVGFIKGLVVKEKVPTPGDFLPDLYVLWQPATNRFYSFVPHNGLCRHDSIGEARNAW